MVPFVYQPIGFTLDSGSNQPSTQLVWIYTDLILDGHLSSYGKGWFKFWGFCLVI